MTCASCETAIPGSSRFCPQCGSPGTSGAVLTETRSIDLDATSTSPRPDPYPAEASETGHTTVLSGPPVTGSARTSGAGTGPGERLAPAARVARDRAQRWADRFGAAPVEVRLAVVGAAVTVLSFLLLPYAEGFGRPVELSGRLWLLPIAAVGATVLLATTLRRPRTSGTATGDDVPRHTDALLAAVVVATAGVVEAGLLGLLTGVVDRPRAGFYGMLLGLVVVAVAAVRAARRRLR